MCGSSILDLCNCSLFPPCFTVCQFFSLLPLILFTFLLAALSVFSCSIYLAQQALYYIQHLITLPDRPTFSQLSILSLSLLLSLCHMLSFSYKNSNVINRMSLWREREWEFDLLRVLLVVIGGSTVFVTMQVYVPSWRALSKFLMLNLTFLL